MNNANRCQNCGGAGKIQAFSHISGVICFECDGTGQEDVFTAKQVAKGKKPRVRNTFYYGMRDGSFEMFVIWHDSTTNRGTLENCRKECRGAIANGGILCDSDIMF